MHIPVLKQEVIEQLNPQPGQTIVDGSFGAGGHARAMLELVSPANKQGVRGKLIGLDRDAGATDAGAHEFKAEVDTGQLILVQARFSEVQNVLVDLAISQIDALLFDAGVSSMQILSSERGFSFSGSGPLDMRMDTRQDLTAAQILAEWSEDDLRSQFLLAGEHFAARIARAVVAARKKEPILTTDQLVELITKAAPPQHARHKSSPIHPATRVFLALRMAVNQELEEIQNGMRAGLQALKPGGRMAVISFHSTEDRVVKQTMQGWTKECICPPELPVCRCNHTPLAKLETKKPITPTAHELATNPRSRSAKLRVCTKL